VWWGCSSVVSCLAGGVQVFSGFPIVRGSRAVSADEASAPIAWRLIRDLEAVYWAMHDAPQRFLAPCVLSSEWALASRTLWSAPVTSCAAARTAHPSRSRHFVATFTFTTRMVLRGPAQRGRRQPTRVPGHPTGGWPPRAVPWERQGPGARGNAGRAELTPRWKRYILVV